MKAVSNQIARSADKTCKLISTINSLLCTFAPSLLQKPPPDTHPPPPPPYNLKFFTTATHDYSLSCPESGLWWDGLRPWVQFTSQHTFPQAWEPVRFKSPKHLTLLFMHALTTCNTHHLFYNHNSLDQDLFPVQSSAPFSLRLWVLLVCSCVWR